MPEVTLYVARGLPGLGKTVWALELVTHGHGRVARVSRQTLREGMFQRKAPMDRPHEKSMMIAVHLMAWALLTDGFSVVADGTNLRLSDVDKWCSLAGGVPRFVAVEIHDFGADVAASRAGVALRRSRGGRNVPDTEIRRMAEKYTPLPDGYGRRFTNLEITVRRHDS